MKQWIPGGFSICPTINRRMIHGFGLGLFMMGFGIMISILIPSLKAKIAPENGWLGDEFPFRKAYLLGLC